ncbi:MAG: VanZ family protein [Candidatus Pacearchaeota archaeon]
MKRIIQKFDQDKQAKIILTLIAALGIFLFSSIPGSKGPSTGFSFIPIAYHLLAFTIFGFFLFSSIKENPTKRHFLIALIVAIMYGILDEMHQIFVPLRNPSLLDVGIDFAGALIGTTTYYKIKY